MQSVAETVAVVMVFLAVAAAVVQRSQSLLERVVP